MPRFAAKLLADGAWHPICSSLTQMFAAITIATAPILAAAGWSLLYLLFGGGIGGAILIFIVLKLIGK